MFKFWRDRARRMAHAEKRIAEQEDLGRRIQEQDPKVKELASFARRQMAENHLSEMFGRIVNEGRAR